MCRCRQTTTSGTRRSSTRNKDKNMWCLVMTTVWLLAAATTCARGGVPPAPMHARRPYDQPPQDLLRSETGAASVVADESWTNKRDTASTLQASQLMLRSPRSSRQYDVPQIECPPAADGMERFACPTPDRQGRYRCIDDHVLCDGFIDCPAGEDEDRQACMFYKTTKAHLDVLADALLRWARGR